PESVRVKILCVLKPLSERPDWLHYSTFRYRERDSSLQVLSLRGDQIHIRKRGPHVTRRCQYPQRRPRDSVPLRHYLRSIPENEGNQWRRGTGGRRYRLERRRTRLWLLRFCRNLSGKFADLLAQSLYLTG